MDKKLKIVVTIVVLIALVVGGYFATKAITGLSVNTNYSNMDEFAQCLSTSGAKMYGAYWCGHCQNQKAMFGESVQYISYIECDPRGENSETDLCLQKGITGYPTWEINGKFYSGELSLEKIAELSGCSLNK